MPASSIMRTESQISDLINHSGRLRMLSHRAGMLLTYIATNTYNVQEFKLELPITLEKFNSNFNKITDCINNDEFLSAAYTEFNRKKQLNALNIDNVVNQFLSQADTLSRTILRNETLPEEQLFNFLEFISNTLLAALNSLVAFFEFSLSRITDQKLNDIKALANDITQSLDEVNQINLSTKILSFNANVEAARAGEQGKGFAVVSKEMNALSAQTKSVSERIKKYVGAFIDALDK